jgi:hypothetical protein
MMTIECKHGQLARSCSICALEAELAEVIARRDKLLASALAPSAPDGWRPFLTDVITAAGLLTHGKRDKRLAERIGSFAFDAMRTSAPTPPEVEPALVVEVEPDYWSGGHYYEGSKPHISPLKVWKLPVGTKLYTAPPAPSVPDGLQTIPSHEQLTQILNGLDRCVSAESRREFLRVWLRDWTVHKLAAPQPLKLSDERILEIWANNSGRPVTMGKARIIAQARAIERELFLMKGAIKREKGQA